MTATTTSDRLLTISEAAEVLRMPVDSLRWHRARGTGPKMFRLGRRVVVRESQLWAWVRQVEERAEAAAHTP
jgi:predicted DNA-binding transcriptional regulator AlpA